MRLQPQHAGMTAEPVCDSALPFVMRPEVGGGGGAAPGAGRGGKAADGGCCGGSPSCDSR